MALESPHIRRRPTRAKPANAQRDSNLVRASVLETALELGLGQSSIVADWIFNNPLSEESEESHPEPDDPVHDTKSEPTRDIAEAATPTYMLGSNSALDESSLNSLGNHASSAALTTFQAHTRKPSVTESPHVCFGDFSSDQLQLFSPFTLSPHDARLGKTKGDLLANLIRDAERSYSQDDSLHCNIRHESPSPGSNDTGYTSEGQYLSKGKVGKGKDKSKGNKGLQPRALDVAKIGEKDGDYASDGGYLSASSNKSQGKSPGKVKSRAMAFFRRRPKKTGHASDDEDEDSIPPVPAIPFFPRPSSPKPLERRVTPSSPMRSGFSPLTLNLTSPPVSPPRRRVSKSPPPVHARAAPPVAVTPTATAATIPLPHSTPGTPVSAIFPASSSPPTQFGVGMGSTPKLTVSSSSRQHLNIPPPAPPPNLPLPQPPPSPSTLPSVVFPPPAPVTLSGSVPTRPVPVPLVPGSTRPLTPRKAASPFTPHLSPGALPAIVSYPPNGDSPNGPEGDRPNGVDITWRQRPGAVLPARFGNTPAFLQRRIQHGPPPSPRHPPPDIPLPPSPCLTPNTRRRMLIGSHSKFHEHLSSVSSVPLSQVLPTSMSMSPSSSIVTLSESSSDPSVRSLQTSSVSDRSEGPTMCDPSNMRKYSRPTTSSSVSEVSYRQPISSTFGRPEFNSRYSGQSDGSLCLYPPTTDRYRNSVTTYDDDMTDVDDVASKSYVDEEDDDASVYPSEDKTAGRRTMYLVEHGELDVFEEEIATGRSNHWGGDEISPPLPLLPYLPPAPTRPGPGYL